MPLAAGTYLPLTAVLGGLLFVRPDGFMEADRDVIRLDPDVAVMQAQQGYVCCPPTPASFRQGRDSYVPALHCSVRVLPSQVGSPSLPVHTVSCSAAWPSLCMGAAVPDAMRKLIPKLQFHTHCLSQT